MNKTDSIYVSGHTGLVGSAICRALSGQGFTNVWTASHRQLGLTIWEDVDFFFKESRPDYVFHCAAKVGGIQDNIDKPADFLVENLEIQSNVFQLSHKYGVKKLLYLSSAAVYPEAAFSPLRPASLMTGPLDETKSGYAMAKLCGMQMCKEFRKQFKSDFISVIPNNVYGPGDKSSHVIPDMMRRFVLAKLQNEVVTCWGDGSARREFIYADDLADACLFLMENYSGDEPVNVGTNKDWSMMDLAYLIAGVTGYKGEICWDPAKPVGCKRRLLDSSAMIGYGWTAKTPLLDGLIKTYNASK